MLRSPPDCEGDRARVMCFPHAGGFAFQYIPLGKFLQHRLEVEVFEYCGRGSRRGEVAAASIHAIATDACRAVVYHDGPTILVGVSMGAVVAFEVARRLLKLGNRRQCAVCMPLARWGCRTVHRDRCWRIGIVPMSG